MNELKRVLKSTGTVWINLGDTYQASTHGGGGDSHLEGFATKDRFKNKEKIKPKSRMGIPERFYINCIDNGWLARNNIVWYKCLSENTKVFAQIDNKYTFCKVKDLKQGDKVPTLDPKGKQSWINVKNIYKNGKQKCVKATTTSGNEIICTPNHKFPYTVNGYVGKFNKIKLDEIKNLKGYHLNCQSKFNIDFPKPESDDYDIGYLVGFFLAEGNYERRKYPKYKDTVYSLAAQRRWGRTSRETKIVGIKLSCGVLDISRGFLDKINPRFKFKQYQYGNKVSLQTFDKKTLQLIQKYIQGDVSSNKHFTNDIWNKSKTFMQAVLQGYLDGDGHYDTIHDRYRIGTTFNPDLKDDISLLCKLLGYDFRYEGITKIEQYTVQKFTIRYKSNRKKLNSVIKDKIQSVEDVGVHDTYDIEVEQFPTSFKTTARLRHNNLYFLGNGIWTHNSNSMPSSVKDRFTNKYENVFFFAKSQKYYFDLDAVREKSISETKPFNVRVRDSKRVLVQAKLTGGMSDTEDENYNHKGELLPKSKFGDTTNQAKHGQGIHSKRGKGLVQKRNLPDKFEFIKVLKENWTLNQVVEKGIPFHTCKHWFRTADNDFSYPSVENWKKMNTELFPELIDCWYETDAVMKNRTGRKDNNEALGNRNFMPIKKSTSEIVLEAGYEPEELCPTCGRKYKRHVSRNRGVGSHEGYPVFCPCSGARKSNTQTISRTHNGIHDMETGESLNNPKGKNPGDFWQGMTDVRQENKSQDQYSKRVYEARHSGQGHDNPLGDPKGKNPGDVFFINPRPFPEAHHATYPVNLPLKIIKCACPKDGIVLDCFFGAGTTAVAAEQLGRRWIGIELNPEYIEIARKRLDKYKNHKLERGDE